MKTRTVFAFLIPLLFSRLLLSCAPEREPDRYGISGSGDGGTFNMYQQDFLELASYIRKTHAGFAEEPLPAMGEEDYDALVTEIRDEMGGTVTRDEFLIRTAWFLEKLHDGHTRVYYPFEEFAPFTVCWFGDRLFIIDAADENREELLYREVVTVGNLTVGEYEEKINPYIPADKNHLLAKRTGSQDIMFSRVYLDYFGLLTAEGDLELGIRERDRISTVTLPCRSKRTYSRSVIYRQGRDALTRVKKGNHYALLPEYRALYFQLNSLRGNVDKKLYREVFSTLADNNLEYLILDLRNNGGGNSLWCNDFLSYLVREKTDVYLYRGWRSNYPQKNRQTGDGINAIEPSAESLHFSGDVILLTSPYTFSSATFFVVAALDNGLGTVIGEPPGNTCIRYGYSAKPVRLANTGLQFYTTHHIWGRAKPGMMNEGEYIYPDIYVSPDPEDFKNGVDTVFESALKYMENRQ